MGQCKIEGKVHLERACDPRCAQWTRAGSRSWTNSPIVFDFGLYLASHEPIYIIHGALFPRVRIKVFHNNVTVNSLCQSGQSHLPSSFVWKYLLFFNCEISAISLMVALEGQGTFLILRVCVPGQHSLPHSLLISSEYKFKAVKTTLGPLQ